MFSLMYSSSNSNIVWEGLILVIDINCTVVSRCCLLIFIFEDSHHDDSFFIFQTQSYFVHFLVLYIFSFFYFSRTRVGTLFSNCACKLSINSSSFVHYTVLTMYPCM